MSQLKNRTAVWVVLGVVGLVLLVTIGAVAVSNIAANNSLKAKQESEAIPAPTEAPTPTGIPTEVPPPTPLPTEPEPEAISEATEEVTDSAETENGILTEDDRPNRLRGATGSWNTNWNKHIIEYDELLSGGPPRDGIPSIDDPKFIAAGEAADWLEDNEPVIVLEIDGDARAYPLQILTWHEIVNDTVADVPVIVTFCPLCNSAITFDRGVDGQVYEFGTSGLLRNSDLVMYDRTTESLWQQLTGEAIVGDEVGKRLDFLPSSIVSFADFRQAYPEGMVMSRDTGHRRDYGRNPYAGYDTIGNSPFLFDGKDDDRLPAMERVVTVGLDDTDVAYPLSILSEVGVINDAQSGHDLVVFHADGTSSALGAGRIAEADDVGATGVFDPNLEGQKLTFQIEGGEIVDEQTGTTWSVLGQAIDGPLAGKSLTPIVHGDHFWFAWAAFKPDTVVFQGG